MKKGRSNYNFLLNCDVNQANQLVQSYIRANGFKLEEKNGEAYYKAGDSMVGYRYFNYGFSGNNLVISAWLKGVFGEIAIEQEGLTGINMQIVNYRNSLGALFQEIEKLNSSFSNVGSMNNNGFNYDPNTGQPINGNIQNNVMRYDPNTGQPINGANMNNANTFVGTFQDENVKRQEKMCEIGFWLSIVGLFCSFFGVSYGIIVYIMNFYFASQGLKTSKAGKAKATIILSVISIVIIILEIIMAM